jgi:hypothetical protein
MISGRFFCVLSASFAFSHASGNPGIEIELWLGFIVSENTV